jgi:hypothetical protein
MNLRVDDLIWQERAALMWLAYVDVLVTKHGGSRMNDEIFFPDDKASNQFLADLRKENVGDLF